MNRIKCYDVATMVIDEATNQFGSLWKVSRSRLDDLKESCKLIDELSDESHGVSYDVDIDDRTMDISVTLECEDLITDSKDHTIYSLMNVTKSINMFAHEGNLCIKFKFGSIWDKAI